MISNLQIIPLESALGAEVLGLDLSKPIPEGVARELKQAYLDHLLLLFRNQKSQDQDLIRVSQIFGKLMMPPAAHERSNLQANNALPEITVVSNVKINGVPIGELGSGEVVWHSDYSFREIIGGMRILQGLKIPPRGAGGTTEFANMYAAYDDLPANMKEFLLTASIQHDTAYDTNRTLRMGAKPVDDPSKGNGPIHPVVSTHPETNCNSLFLGRRLAHYLMGQPLAVSEGILDRLWAHATSEQYVYRHEWAEGDVVLWDNRCTIHRRGPFDSTQERILHAAQVLGHKPFCSEHAKFLQPHSRSKR